MIDEPKKTELRIAHERVATLAYQHWHERGCPEGTPEEDWFTAEEEVAAQDFKRGF